jgi:hypothetical protein
LDTGGPEGKREMQMYLVGTTKKNGRVEKMYDWREAEL